MDAMISGGNDHSGNGTADPGRNGGGKPHRSASRGMARWNALKHGVLSECAVLPTEDRAQFDELLRNLRKDRNPQGALEEVLVEKIAICVWRQRRILRYDCRFELDGSGSGTMKVTVEHIGRRPNCKPDGPAVQSDDTCTKANANDGPAQVQSPPPTNGTRAEANAPAIVTDYKKIDTLIRYDTSIERQFYRAIDQLERLQRQRAGDYVPPPVKVGLSTDV